MDGRSIGDMSEDTVTFQDMEADDTELVISGEDGIVKFSIREDGREKACFHLDPNSMGELAAALFNNS